MLVTISRYSFPYEAQIAKAKLASEGIPAFIADEHTINAQWLYSNAMGGVRLQVYEEYAAQASQILSTDYSDEVVDQEGFDAISCPVCGSHDTEYHQKGRRLAFLVFLGLDFPLFPIRHGVKCKDCGSFTETEK